MQIVSISSATKFSANRTMIAGSANVRGLSMIHDGGSVLGFEVTRPAHVVNPILALHDV